MPATNIPTDNHPDLCARIAAELNNLNDRWPPELQHAGQLTADDLDVLCQRTWTSVRTMNSRIDGEALSIPIVRYKQPHPPLTAFVVTVQVAGTDTWGIAGMSFGQQPPGESRVGGFMVGGGSHVAIGGVGSIPPGGKLSVTMADGSVFEDTNVDGCAIVFAPVMTPATTADEITVRMLDADGSVLESFFHWVGDGKPPPGVRPRAG